MKKKPVKAPPKPRRIPELETDQPILLDMGSLSKRISAHVCELIEKQIALKLAAEFSAKFEDAVRSSMGQELKRITSIAVPKLGNQFYEAAIGKRGKLYDWSLAKFKELIEAEITKIADREKPKIERLFSQAKCRATTDGYNGRSSFEWASYDDPVPIHQQS